MTGSEFPVADMIAAFGKERWTVSVEQVDDRLHVSPVRGLLVVESVRLNRYPRTVRGTRRAVRIVQRWCDRENAKLDRGAELHDRYNAVSK